MISIRVEEEKILKRERGESAHLVYHHEHNKKVSNNKEKYKLKAMPSFRHLKAPTLKGRLSSASSVEEEMTDKERMLQVSSLA